MTINLTALVVYSLVLGAPTFSRHVRSCRPVRFFAEKKRDSDKRRSSLAASALKMRPTALFLGLLLVGASNAGVEATNSGTVGCRDLETTRVRIGINYSGLSSPFLGSRIRQVVDEVWTPYGLSFSWSAVPVSVVPRDADLALIVQLEPIAAAPDGLGAAIFGPDGPAPVIQLSASTAIREIKRTRYRNLSGRELLKIDRVAESLGLLLGQAAAHEVGHVLLRSKAHAANGLMAASFSSEIPSLRRARQRLDPASERQLLEILGQGTPCG